MDSATFPTLTTAERERFFTEGEDARAGGLPQSAAPGPIFIKIRAHDCCVGRDLPGIGHAHAHDCSACVRAAELAAQLRGLLAEAGAEPLPVVSSSTAVAQRGHLPGPLQSMIAGETEAGASRARREYDTERERMHNLLEVATRDLVAMNIRLRGTGFADGGQRWCWECQIQEHEGCIRHRLTCATGRVEGILQTLSALGKRPEEKMPRAERPLPNGPALLCRKCGVRDRAWTLDATVGDALLESNQARVAGENLGFDIYTHHCDAAGGARPLGSGLSILAILFFLLASMHLGAQAVPAATRAHLDRIDWALVGVDAGVRGLDVYSTHRMLERGNHEDFLPPAIADHVPAMAAFSGGCVAAEFLTARWLSRRHPRLARLAPLADIAIDAPFAFHNLALPQVGPAKFSLGVHLHGGAR